MKDDPKCDQCGEAEQEHEGLCEPCAIETWDAQQDKMIGYRDRDELKNNQIKWQELK